MLYVWVYVIDALIDALLGIGLAFIQENLTCGTSTSDPYSR